LLATFEISKRGRDLGLELDLLAEYGLFAKRHHRYASVFVAIYGYSMSAWRATRPLRATYALTQAIDDLLDGDRSCAREPEDEVRAILADTLSDGHRLSRIARFVMPHLARCNATDDFRKLVDCMILDRIRVRENRRLTEAQLQKHHRTVFECSANVALCICGFELRAGDVPGVIRELSWCSPARDLKEDLYAGLNNIPFEIYPGTGDALMDPRVRKWLRREYNEMLVAMSEAEKQLLAVHGRSGAFGFRIFHRLLSAYAKKYPRIYPEVFDEDPI